MMVLENELSAAKFYEKSSMMSVALKSVIMLSTLVLIGLVIKFHVHEVQLFMNANSAEDWRIALTWRRCFQVALELFACGICPIPLDISFSWKIVHPDSLVSCLDVGLISIFLERDEQSSSAGRCSVNTDVLSTLLDLPRNVSCLLKMA